MIIKSRFVHNGVNCFSVEDSGFDYNVTFRGLYEYDIMTGLVEAGYKFMDYHGNILTPEGISINEIAEESNILSEAEIIAMLDYDDIAMTEEEAAKYFTRDVEVTEIELKKSSNKIKTREEFLSYLETYIKLERVGLNDDDCLPINSFVAREALFTMEEIQSSPTIRFYMDVISRRRKPKSFEAYMKVIEFLKRECGLPENYTADDVKSAYIEWGLCGINVKILKREDMLGVATRIFSKESEGIDAKSSEFGLLDKNGNVTVLNKTANFCDEDDLEMSSFIPESTKEFWDLMHSTTSWNTKYKVVKALVPNPRTRTYMTIMDNSGITYRVKLDHDTIVINSSRDLVLSQRFLEVRSYNKEYITIDKACNEKEYKTWCLIMAKVYEIVKQKTRKPEFKSSYDLLVKSGLSPISAIEYMSQRVIANRQLNDHLDPEVDYAHANKLYQDGPSAEIIRKYNPDDLPYESLDELIEIMCNKRDELRGENKYLDITTDPSARAELAERPIERLEFVKNARLGLLSIDNFGRGLREDSNVEYNKFANWIRTVANVILGDDVFDEQKLMNFLLNITDYNEIIETLGVFPTRDRAYKGAIMDRAILNNIRAQDMLAAVHILRVYREIGNIPADKQRDYMFDCIALKLTEKSKNPRVALHNRVAEAISSAIAIARIPHFAREVLLKEAYAMAIHTMFNIAWQPESIKDLQNLGDTVRFKLTVNVDGPVDLIIDLSAEDYRLASNKNMYEVHTKCQLYNWCVNELHGNRIRLYCLNANITPWAVIPKKDVIIPSYNFAINYLPENIFAKVSPEVREACENNKGRVDELFKTGSQLLIPNQFEDMGITYTETNINNVLSFKNEETITDYYNRFTFNNTLLKQKGKALIQIPLKSDIIFANYATPADNIISEMVYDDIEKVDTKLWVRSSEVNAVGRQDTVAIKSGNNEVSTFNIKEQSLSDLIRWSKLLVKPFVPKAATMIYGTTWMCITGKGQLQRDLNDISLDDCIKLANKEIFYQLGAREFLVPAGSVYYKVEVR